MLYDLSGLVPFIVAFLAVAAIATVVALGAAGVVLTEHHRVRVARHQSIPTYYRRLVLAH